ncbi:hypothetical protein [Anaeromassilibacillus senegalensis]|uniref:hypothetical protein n=1 Tax=Anaeromassilibacillus senegalensis TaxID=1673717 RepID=UPI00068035B7|nr:hypothetical protein [Anaeromassilibacillus senegalensis]
MNDDNKEMIPEQEVQQDEEQADNGGKPRRKFNKKAYTFGIALLLMFFAISIYRTHMNGFGMIVQTTDTYNYEVQTLEQPVLFTIDLDDLKGNEGNNIYSDGDCTINISTVEKADDGYLLTFMANPKHDFFQNYAVLVSAAQEEYQIVPDGTAHLAVLKAELNGSYQDEAFVGEPGEANDIGTLFTYTIPVEETTGKVTLTFSGLRKMNWDIKR